MSRRLWRRTTSRVSLTIHFYTNIRADYSAHRTAGAFLLVLDLYGAYTFFIKLPGLAEKLIRANKYAEFATFASIFIYFYSRHTLLTYLFHPRRGTDIPRRGWKIQ